MKTRILIAILLVLAMFALMGNSGCDIVPTDNTSAPAPTAVPATAVPPTAVPALPTKAPPPPTVAPSPTSVPPTAVPPTEKPEICTGTYESTPPVPISQPYDGKVHPYPLANGGRIDVICTKEPGGISSMKVVEVKPTVLPTASPTVAPTVMPPTKAPDPTKAPAAPASSTSKYIKSDGTVDVDKLFADNKAPFKTVATKDDKGRAITKLEGFDLNEFGGNDNLCTKKELEQIHIGERVGSVGEPCKIVVEWSLKYSDQTIITGVYALEPGEWFYVPLAVAGQKGSPRIIGTAHYLPKLWNAHMYSANIASVRDATDHTTSIVGLSPTDDYVVMLANALLGK